MSLWGVHCLVHTVHEVLNVHLVGSVFGEVQSTQQNRTEDGNITRQSDNRYQYICTKGILDV